MLNGEPSVSSRQKCLSVNNAENALILTGLFLSDVFWWWYSITSNMRDLNPSDLNGFKFPSTIFNDSDFLNCCKTLKNDLISNSKMQVREQKKTGHTETQLFKIALSKSIISDLDKIMAKHYGFTEEELDFIINYDIKYRMSDELNADSEE